MLLESPNAVGTCGGVRKSRFTIGLAGPFKRIESADASGVMVHDEAALAADPCAID